MTMTMMTTMHWLLLLLLTWTILRNCNDVDNAIHSLTLCLFG